MQRSATWSRAKVLLGRRGVGSDQRAAAAEVTARDHHVMSNGWNRALGIHAVLVACRVAHERVVTVLEIVIAPPAAGRVEFGHDDRDVARGRGLASRRGQLAPARSCVPTSWSLMGTKVSANPRNFVATRPTERSRRDADRTNFSAFAVSRSAGVTWPLRFNGSLEQRHRVMTLLDKAKVAAPRRRLLAASRVCSRGAARPSEDRRDPDEAEGRRAVA